MDIILCKTKKPVTRAQLLNMIHIDEHGHSIFKPDNELVEGKEIDLSNLGSNLLPPTISNGDVTWSIGTNLDSDSFDPPHIIETDIKIILSG